MMQHLARVWLMLAVVVAPTVVTAHPLGNFSINQLVRLTIEPEGIRAHAVVDLAEIPTFQAMDGLDRDHDGHASGAELDAYAAASAAAYAELLRLEVDRTTLPLRPRRSSAVLTASASGLDTLRLEYDLRARFVAPSSVNTARFDNGNFEGRAGWREIVIVEDGVTVFDSTAFGSSLTDDLRVYPDDSLAIPLSESSASFAYTTGPLPAGAEPLLRREGKIVARAPDPLVALLSGDELSWRVLLLALWTAAGLGALHALSPGHGKTIVGAYLVGAKGTARHALFLGLTVTVTHTIGVFALGAATLWASHYILPERLLPGLSLVSGALVLFTGLGLVSRRLHGAAHEHDHGHDHEPGSDGGLRWGSLLALGVSGGLVPCPSALVVLLSAVALRRIVFGLGLIVAFSAGLAMALTSVGLAFIWAGRLMPREASARRWAQVLPLVSAGVITLIGGGLTYAALRQLGVDPLNVLASTGSTGVATSPLWTLSAGFVFGLKHALDADHLAAVSTIVTAKRGGVGAWLVGAAWGVGHTLTLFAAAVAVVVLHVEIREQTAAALEFGVAVMLVVLGLDALRRGWRHQEGEAHIHAIGEVVVEHPHGLGAGLRPLVVGMIHGLAGSAALMLLVLSTIPSPRLALVYVAMFGAGSIGGMVAMSVLISLPLRLGGRYVARADAGLRIAAALFSIGLGASLAYEIGVTGGLLG